MTHEYLGGKEEWNLKNLFCFYLCSLMSCSMCVCLHIMSVHTCSHVCRSHVYVLMPTAGVRCLSRSLYALSTEARFLDQPRVHQFQLVKPASLLQGSLVSVSLAMGPLAGYCSCPGFTKVLGLWPSVIVPVWQSIFFIFPVCILVVS